ncbi:NucA/NucB deoxyribonuclease domain-containing protein [Streptomyces niveus]|uniref:NucA/NucB deoxyribonuclease domain-containing protein n=1 Tax=Streptomyces niveus TaxID=193462 RepID=UPI0034449548
MKVLVPQDQAEEWRERGRKAQRERSQLPKVDKPFQTSERPAEKPGPKAADLTLTEAAAIASRDAKGRSVPMNSRTNNFLAQQKSGEVDAAQGGGITPKAASAAIGETPPQALLDACMTGEASAERGRIYDRFTFCQRAPMQAEYWEVDASGQPVEHMGTTKATMEIVAQGFDDQRSTRVFAQVQKDSVSYDWGIWDDIWTAPGVPLSLVGICSQGQFSCGASRSPATLTWDNWDNNPSWAYWDIGNSSTLAFGRDKIMFSSWQVQYFTDDNEISTTERGSSAAQLIRCDSATYIVGLFGAARPHGCVFPGAYTHLTYSATANEGKVAEHIYYAQWFSNDTFPLLAPPGEPAPRDKEIPGAWVAGGPDGAPLHRITPTLHPTEYKANRDHKDGACYGTGPEAATYDGLGLDPRPNTPAEQCDEYPFASTLEGGASQDWDFSVRAVPERDNLSAGGTLVAYYNADRVLAWDATLPEPDVSNDMFWVEIVP